MKRIRGEKKIDGRGGHSKSRAKTTK